MKYFTTYEKPNQKEIEDFKLDFLKDKGLLKEVNINKSTYLHIAVMHGNFELAKIVIDNGIDVNFQDYKKSTALHYCADYNRYDIAKYILEHGGKLNISDKYGNEPLWTAVMNVKKDLVGLEIVKLYLMNGADKNHINKFYKSPIDAAATSQHILDLFTI